MHRIHRKQAMELLVISSGPTLARTLRLRRYGHHFVVRQTLKDAATIDRTEMERAALILVDVGPDQADWPELCERLGAGRTIPLIFLIPKPDPLMAAAILNSGADDCLPKPFDPDELLLRVRAILRRNGPQWAGPPKVLHTASAGMGFQSAPQAVTGYKRTALDSAHRATVPTY